jgi:hypothetical protein
MTELHRVKFMFISTVLLVTLIGGCVAPTPTQVAEQSESPWVDVRVIPGEESLVRVVQTEKIVQPNCGGTLEVENVVERSRTIIHTVELGGGVEVNAQGEVGLLGTGVQVGAAIAAQYGQAYSTEDKLARAVSVRAKEGTSMEHTIQQVEIWQVGTVEITIGDQQFIYPYHFRNDFSVELVKSQNIGCPPIEGVSSTPMATPTNILTSAPALPTDTPRPLLVSLLFEDDFDVGPRSEWEIVSGTWGTADGQFTLIDISEWPAIGIALVGDTSWNNYAVEFDVTGLYDDDPRFSGLQIEGYGTEDMETVYSSRAAVLVGIDEKGNGAGFIIGEKYMVWGTFSNGLWSNIISGTLVQAYGDEGGHLLITVQGNLYKVYDSKGAMLTSFSTLGGKGGRVGIWLNSHRDLSASDWRAVPKIDNFSVTPLD